MTEAVRARWFALYAAVFAALVVAIFVFGLMESRILGFLGLSRLVVPYIQVCMAAVSIFILITTVRSVGLHRAPASPRGRPGAIR